LHKGIVLFVNKQRKSSKKKENVQKRKREKEFTLIIFVVFNTGKKGGKLCGV
jgi:hypothetical protein